MRGRLFWLLGLLFVGLFSRAAQATANFPLAIAATLELKVAPNCTLCHTTPEGEKGTATQPFARKLQANGLMPNDAPTLITLLAKMRDAKDDTDRDGMSDIDEIKAGRDPNINDITGEPPEDYPPPVYGCQVSAGPGRGAPVTWISSIAAAGLAVARSLRRRVPRARLAIAPGRASRKGKRLSAAVGALLLLAATLAACQNAPLDVVDGVDLGRFQGRWFEIAHLPRATQIDCAGTTAYYQLTSERELVVTNECSVGGLAGVRRQVKASAKVTNAAVPAKLSVDFGGFYGDYWIIDLDRDGYRFAAVGHPTRQYLWILSREPTLDTQTLKPILERAAQKGFDTGKLEYTKQQP